MATDKTTPLISRASSPRWKTAAWFAGVRARRHDVWLRLAMSRLANSVRSELLGDGLRDTGCALKAFRSEVVDAFPLRTLYSFMGAMAVAAEFLLCQIEVAHRPRRHGQSKYGLSVFWWKPLIDTIGVLWFSRRRLSGPVGGSELVRVGEDRGIATNARNDARHLASDMREVISTMRFSGSLERIADRAVSIARRSRKLVARPAVVEMSHLEPIFAHAQTMVRDAVRSFAERDLPLTSTT